MLGHRWVEVPVSKNGTQSSFGGELIVTTTSRGQIVSFTLVTSEHQQDDGTFVIEIAGGPIADVAGHAVLHSASLDADEPINSTVIPLSRPTRIRPSSSQKHSAVVTGRRRHRPSNALAVR